MLGEMVAVEAQPIVIFDEVEALLVKVGQRQIVAVEMIENAELHGSPWGGPTVCMEGAKMIDF
jgi:hypothetical protein